MSIKHGCLRCFVAKRPYLDGSLCHLIYEHIDHTNKYGEPCHGSTVAGFRHALGSNIYEDMKVRIEQMHALGLSPAQIMSQHKQNVKELAKCNERVTKNIFLLPSNVRNICKKIVEELWENILQIQLAYGCGYMKTPALYFFYQEHSLLDLNNTNQEDIPFNLGIQTKWQQQMMAIFAHNSAIAIDATFGTNQIRVCCYLKGLNIRSYVQIMLL